MLHVEIRQRKTQLEENGEPVPIIDRVKYLAKVLVYHMSHEDPAKIMYTKAEKLILAKRIPR